jgi:hypothetical protein
MKKYPSDDVTLVDLAKLVPPPAVPCDFVDASTACAYVRSKGLSFPSEFLAFAHMYGTGHFVSSNTHEIIVYNPCSPYYLERISRDTRALDSLLIHMVKLKSGLQRTGLAGVLPAGRDTDDGLLIWLTNDDPNKWRIALVCHSKDTFEVFDGGIVRFLVSYFGNDCEVVGWRGRRVAGRVPVYRFETPWE